MPLTPWEMLQAMVAVMLLGVLAVLVGVLLLRLSIPVVRRYAWLRVCLKMVGWLLLAAGGMTVLVVVLNLLELRTSTLETYGPSAVALAVGGGLYAWGRLAWRVRKESLVGPRCHRCGYDLAGLELSADPLPPCPECGRVVSSRRRLYRPRVRKWATRAGVLLIVLGVVAPPGMQVYQRGWAGAIPDWLLLRLVVSNVQATPALEELGHRGVNLYDKPPHWTRDLMRSFADEYDVAAVGAAGGSMPWQIYNRFYPLYQGSRDEVTVALAESWLTSASVGKRFTASGMMTVEGFCPAENRLRLLRPLLKDPEVGVRSHALRGLTFDAALPLEELLAFCRAPQQAAWSGELNSALTRYSDPAARAVRLSLSANAADPWADHITWSLMFEGFSFEHGTVTSGTLTTLARAKAVYPTARTVWSRASFKLVYDRLIDAAVARPGTDGEDAETAAWCRGALQSYATTPPGPMPGALATQAPVIVAAIDDQIAAETDAAVRKRLMELRGVLVPVGQGTSEDASGVYKK